MEITGDRLQVVIESVEKASDVVGTFFSMKPLIREIDSRAATHEELPPNTQEVSKELKGIQWANLTADERDIISGPDVKGSSPTSGEQWYAGLNLDGGTLFSKRNSQNGEWVHVLVVPEKNITGPDAQSSIIDPARLVISKGGRESIYVRPAPH